MVHFCKADREVFPLFYLCSLGVTQESRDLMLWTLLQTAVSNVLFAMHMATTTTKTLQNLQQICSGVENSSLKFRLAETNVVLAGGSRKALTSWQDIDFGFMQIDPHKIKVSRFSQFIAMQKSNNSHKFLLVSFTH